jgi:mannonate dehydratase
MKLTMLLPAKYDEKKWILAKQIGVNYAITKAASDLSGKPGPYNFKALKSIKEEFNSAGFNLYGLEGDQFDMSAIKLGLTNRDEVIENYQAMLRNMGQLEIPLLCYNFMAVIGWFRTRTDVKERGGAWCSEFDIADIRNELVPEDQRISEEELWDNFFYFLDAVLPVAQEAGVKMALHPDDPPLSPLKGVGRIFTTAESFEKVLVKYPGDHNGITFCQATFKTMGEDIKSISEKWLKKKKVFFIHLRDIEGNKYKFRETFPDNGSTRMSEMLGHYYNAGFDGPLRPDHVPAMYGEAQGVFSGGMSVGYEVTGKIFAVGHIKGICESLSIPLE